MTTICVNLGPDSDAIPLTLPAMTDATFFEFCQRNRDLRIERSAEGEIRIMPPTGGETGSRNIRIARYLDTWAEQDNTGLAFDSSTGFKLPNGATRSPDASWVAKYRWEALTDEGRKSFVPLCPEFVVELLSPTDSLSDTQDKMEEYIANGALLGWLIDRKKHTVYVYRAHQSVEELTEPTQLSGETVLPGFVLDMRRIW